MKPQFSRYGVLIVICTLTACTTVAHPNPNDPYESYNRSMFQFNDKADQYVMQPVARGYRKITPKPVRKAVTNFTDNLRDVVSLGSNILRGNVAKAGTDFMRVAVNTTFGLGGLINIADEAGMPNNKNTLGDTFASWGWKKSHYFVYPLLGPSTVRDSVANTITGVYSPDRAIFTQTAGRVTATAVKAVNQREQFLDVTDRLEKLADGMDKYAYTRDFYMSIRASQVNGGLPQGLDSDDDIDQLVPPEKPVSDETSVSESNATTLLEAPLMKQDFSRHKAGAKRNHSAIHVINYFDNERTATLDQFSVDGHWLMAE